MGITKKWFLLETEEDYDRAMDRYQVLKSTVKGTDEHREEMLLVYLIQNFESKHYLLPEVDPIEMIKIRMKEFGFNSTTLAKEYGDKGTVSKVLNYKQSLSLSMIRKFSQLRKIPAEWLIKEYPLHKTG